MAGRRTKVLLFAFRKTPFFRISAIQSKVKPSAHQADTPQTWIFYCMQCDIIRAYLLSAVDLTDHGAPYGKPECGNCNIDCSKITQIFLTAKYNIQRITEHSVFGSGKQYIFPTIICMILFNFDSAVLPADLQLLLTSFHKNTDRLMSFPSSCVLLPLQPLHP